jgi:hypothetical protein
MSQLIIRGIPRQIKKAVNVEEKEYTKIPDRFTTLAEWPSKCNLLCYTCTAVIEGIPLFVPAAIEPEGIPKIDSTVYCSPSCAVSYINRTFHNKDIYIKFLRTLIIRMIGINISIIESSEDKSHINAYGGNMTSQIYQSRIREMNLEWFNRIAG